MDVRKLPVGPPPKVDAVVGQTLFHNGMAIRLDMNGNGTDAHALGSLDGTAYITADRPGGEQLYRVSDDGSLTAVGTTHDVYDAFPRMSTATGHVFFQYDDRGSAITTLTVMDARTGHVLRVFHGWPGDSKMDPGDRPIVDAMRDLNQLAGVLALSPDGRTGLGVQDDSDGDHPGTEILDQWSLRPKPAVVRHLTFVIPNADDEVSVDIPVFEDDHTFLARAYLPDWSGKGPLRTFVVRCTLDGACERASQITQGEVSIAGEGGVLVPGHFPYSKPGGLR